MFKYNKAISDMNLSVLRQVRVLDSIKNSTVASSTVQMAISDSHENLMDKVGVPLFSFQGRGKNKSNDLSYHIKSAINHNRDAQEPTEITKFNFKTISYLRDLIIEDRVIAGSIFKLKEDEMSLIASLDCMQLLKLLKYNFHIFEMTLLRAIEYVDLFEALEDEKFDIANIYLKKTLSYAPFKGREFSGIVNSTFIMPAGVKPLTTSEIEKEKAESVLLAYNLSENGSHTKNIRGLLPRISTRQSRKFKSTKGNYPRGSSWVNHVDDQIQANMVLGLMDKVSVPFYRDVSGVDVFSRTGIDYVKTLLSASKAYEIFNSGLIGDGSYTKQTKINSERIHWLLDSRDNLELNIIGCGCGSRAYVHHRNPRSNTCPFCKKIKKVNNS